MAYLHLQGSVIGVALDLLALKNLKCRESPEAVEKDKANEPSKNPLINQL